MTSLKARPSTIARTLEALFRVWSHPRCTPEDVRRFQARRLRIIVRHAYETVPYYRRLFDAQGLKPDDIREPSDLRAVPITSRRDLQILAITDVTARGVDAASLLTHASSGSSGEPMAWRRTLLETRIAQAFRLRAMYHFGLGSTDRLASIVARRQEPLDRQFPLNLIRAVGLFRHDYANCADSPADICRRLRHISPTVLGGFAGAVARLADHTRDEVRSAVQPRFVAVGGDVLTPLMRQHIADTFGVPVFELYTSVECGTLAWQCRDTGAFHTCDDGMIFEVLREGAPVAEGERGEVVVTNLHAFAMPLVRYRLGDIVTKGSAACACGQPFGTIGRIEGRMIDYFPLPSGRVIHPYTIVSPLVRDSVSWLRAYRLLQERKDRFVLTVVAAEAPSESQLTALRGKIISLIGEAVEVDIRPVDDLPLEPNGKFRVSRSLVTSVHDTHASPRIAPGASPAC